METIPFSDWQKLDIRVGRILKAEEIPKADKLYKLEIDLGEELGIRTVCAGIKQNYTKEELEGKKCVLFANLQPRTMKGITSEGMILAAVSEDESKICLLEPDADIEAGARIR